MRIGYKLDGVTYKIPKANMKDCKAGLEEHSVFTSHLAETVCPQKKQASDLFVYLGQAANPYPRLLVNKSKPQRTISELRS